MRSLALLVLLGIPGVASAQETAWAAAAVTSTRFPDAEIAGPALAVDDEVRVVLREGDRVRIRKGTAYGWVPAAALTATPPAAPAVAAPAAPLEFDIEAIRRSLQGAGAGAPPTP